MKLVRNYLTSNYHYKINKIISVKRLILHSVGTPQPSPDVYVNIWNKSSAKYLAQIVVGVDKSYELLPCMQTKGKAVFCYHVGNANSNSIGVELTEPSTIKYTSGANFVDYNPTKTKDHVLATYNNAVDVFAQLCEFHNLDPLEDGVILSHSECYKRGIGTNHGDVEHLWEPFGLSMKQFRKDVAAKLGDSESNLDNYDIIVVGNIYNFKGNSHYSSANSSTGKSVNPGRVRVIDKYLDTSKHPILARSVDNSGKFISGNVYGWVDDEELTPVDASYQVKVTATKLNIRSGPSTSYKIVGAIEDKGTYTIVEESNGWGKLKSKVGWISLKYTKKI